MVKHCMQPNDRSVTKQAQNRTRAPLSLLLGLLLWLSGGWGTAEQAVIAKPGSRGCWLSARHDLFPMENVEPFVELDQSNLGLESVAYVAHRSQLPVTSDRIVEPLFGRRLKTVKILDRRLEGATIYLVSGHGGPDPGGIGHRAGHQLCEDEYAYDVTLRLGRRLLEHGAKVHFIIRDPEDGIRDERYLVPDQTERCYPNQEIPLNQLSRLRQRTRAVNELCEQEAPNRYRRCLVIHVDARRRREKIDIFFYHHRDGGDGQRLAVRLRDTVEEQYHAHQPRRGYTGTVRDRGLFVINKTVPPVVFIELGNIHHPRDQERLIEPDNRQALAHWLCEGILRDFESSKRFGR